MMVLRPRQGNLREGFRLFNRMQGFADYETNNLKTRLRLPSRGLNTITDYLSHTAKTRNVFTCAAIFYVSPRIQKKKKMQYAN